MLAYVSMVLLFLYFSTPTIHAQVAGLNTLSVLDLGSTAHPSGLGMDYLPLYGSDYSLAIDNPSILTGSMGSTALVSFAPMFTGSNMGALAYAWNTKHVGTLSLGFRFFNYGRFEGYDEEEMYEGDFGAGDYSLSIGWGLWIDSNFSFGVNFKPVLSQYEQYTAFAQAFDLAASWTSDSRATTATVMARNIGAQITTFSSTVEPLPFELSAALSYKLKNAPFRLYLMLNELQRWNLSYEDPLNPTTEVDPFTGEVHTQSWFVSTLDNVMRHVQLGVELNLGRSLYATVGYNYRQGAEMVGADVLNLSAFSFGLGIRTKRLDFSFARRNFHLSQAPNFFTVAYRF